MSFTEIGAIGIPEHLFAGFIQDRTNLRAWKFVAAGPSQNAVAAATERAARGNGDAGSRSRFPVAYTIRAWGQL